MRHKIIFSFSFCIVFLFSLASATAQKKAVSDSCVKVLNNEIEDLKNDKDFKHVSWSVCVMAVKSGDLIAEYNSDITLIPASTMKVITTGAALAILGKDFRFKTTLEYDGNIDVQGTLHGNLFIRGGGDPTLGCDRFDSTTTIPYIYKQWAKAIKAKGIKKIEGSVIGDADIFEDVLTPPTWVWGDLGSYYGAGPCGLNISENAYMLVFKPSRRIGDSAVIDRTEPNMPYIQFDNRVTIAGSNTGENENTFSFPYSNYQLLVGTIPLYKKEFPVWGSMPDPSYYCAWSFSSMLNDSLKIPVTDKASTLRMLRLVGTVKKTERKIISTTLSPPLSDIIYKTNIYSINIYAEHLLKMMGYTRSGYGGTFSGIYAVVNYWKSKGVDLSGYQMNDGSGLSPMDKVSTRHFTEMLKAYTKEPTYQELYNSLPVAGKSGSLGTSTFKKTFAENNLRAKSGYMTGVRSYIGYVNNKSGEQLCFAIIVNNYTCSASDMRVKLEKLMIKIAETK